MDEKDAVGAVEIGGRTRLCGLIGNPVEHTLSPMIHNTLAAACGKRVGLKRHSAVQDGGNSLFGERR